MPVPLRAGGNVHPMVFVKLDTAADNQVLECGAGDTPFGISQRGTRRAPFEGLDDALAAIAGEELLVYQLHEDCWLNIGASVTPGQRLKPSTGGVGIPVAADQDKYGAIASQAGTSGKLIEVTVVLGERSGA